MVRASNLSREALLAAMEAGDFYASSGVRLKELRREANRLTLRIEPEKGVTYITQFIGTRKSFDANSEPGEVPPKTVRPVTRRYSADIGKVLAEVKGLSPSYTLKGNELYVRAKVISSKLKSNSSLPGETEAAWTQPLVAPASRALATSTNR